MSSPNIHGLAAKIRAATESETFDMGGLPPATIEQVIHDAFAEEWPAIEEEMIRITLVVGAGKQSRQKYHENTQKLVTSTLNDCSYAEDRGASNVADCGGLYKLQHDTGKNLKTVVVFPKFAAREDGGASSSAAKSLLSPDSMEYKVAVCSMAVFDNMLKHKVPSWFQKRNLMQLLEEKIQAPLQEFEQLLLKGQILSDAQQEMYDSCTEIDAKHAALKQAMSTQVDEGTLTAAEKDFLLSQVQSRIEELQENGNPKALQKAQERQSKLKAIQPIPLPPLKHAVALGKLWKQAAPLLYLQSKSGQMTLQETKKLGQLDDLLAEIDELEQDSMGWLEDDDVFEARIQAYRRELQQKYKTGMAGSSGSAKGGGSGGGKSGGGTTKKSTTNAWSSTISANTKVQMPTATNWMSAKDKKAQALQTKKAKMKKGDVFGAMMMDSDSDDSDDEVSSNKLKSTTRDSNTPSKQQNDTQPYTSNSSTNNFESQSNLAGVGKRKNKKKKGSKGKSGDGDDEDAMLNAAISANKVVTETTKKNNDEQSSTQEKNNGSDGALTIILNILQQYIFPFVVAILTFILSLFVGSSKSKQEKKKA
jgi:hypothetical protein